MTAAAARKATLEDEVSVSRYAAGDGQWHEVCSPVHHLLNHCSLELWKV